MVEQELTYQKLQIPSSDIYEAMGYKDSMPDGMVIEEINTLLDRITPLLRPRFFFFLTDGLLDTEKATLTVKDTVLSIGKTIARQLRGSEAFAFFTATAGVEFEEFQHLLQQEDDMETLPFLKIGAVLRSLEKFQGKDGTRGVGTSVL